jgi:hypothetical protein
MEEEEDYSQSSFIVPDKDGGCDSRLSNWPGGSREKGVFILFIVIIFA